MDRSTSTGTSTARRACSSASCAAAGRGRPASTTCAPRCIERRHPAPRLRRRGGARRRADGGCRPCPAPSSPRRSRYLVNGGPGEPRAPPAVRRRHRPARGVRLRPARRDPGPRRLAGDDPHRRPAAGRRRLLPGPPRGREHPVRRRPVRRDRGGRWRRRGRGVVLLAARRRRPTRARPARRSRARRADHHRAGHRRRGCRRPGVAGGPGGLDGDEWDASALGALDVPIVQAPSSGRSVAGVGGRPRAGSAPTTPPPASPSPSSTAASSRPSSPSTRWSTTATTSAPWCAPTARCPTVSRGSPASPSATPGCGARRRRERRVAIVLSAYPTKRSRLGNAVGLDTPASAHRACSHALRGRGLRRRPHPGQRRRRSWPSWPTVSPTRPSC